LGGEKILLTEITVQEVLIYYDRPLLYICVDESSQRYLAVLAEEHERNGVETGETWLYVPIGGQRAAEILSGKFDIREAFEQPELGAQCISLYIPVEGEAIERRVSTVPEKWLPLPGLTINRQAPV
jgi:hypothetical protein